MDQHVISEWLLRAFDLDGQLVLYDKHTDTIEPTSPDDFMVEHDAHGVDVEAGFAAIEGPASRAATRLAKSFKMRPAGVYAMVDEHVPLESRGHRQLRAAGTVAGMTLMLPDEAIWPRREDRGLLANYVALTYQRSPKLETRTRQMREEFTAAAQEALDVAMPGLRANLAEEFGDARARMIERVPVIGPALEAAGWFVVRAPEDESYVLSDSPVNPTIALGHDDEWRAIFANEAFVVAMPLSPRIAVLIARQVIPISQIDASALTTTINRLVWFHADRYVLARNRRALDAGLPDRSLWQTTVRVPVDEGIRALAIASVHRIVRNVALERSGYAEMQRGQVIRWEGCRLVIGRDIRLPGDLD